MSEPTNHILPAGTLLNGRYRIKAVLYQSDFVISYSAEDTWTSSVFCVNELFIRNICLRARNQKVETRFETGVDYSGFKEIFLWHASNMRTVLHPGFVRITDVFEAYNTAYYCSEYLEGKRLLPYLNSLADGNTDAQTMRHAALSVLCSLLQTLADLNTLKPGYLHGSFGDAIIDLAGNVVLCPSDIHLKIHYLKCVEVDPECYPFAEPLPIEIECMIDNEDLFVSVASLDMYCLGRLVYAALSGKKYGVQPRHSPLYFNDNLPGLHEINPLISSGLSEVLMKMWNTSWKCRYPHYNALKLALSDYTLPWPLKGRMKMKFTNDGESLELATGRILNNRYRIDSVKAKGGFAFLYEATDLLHDGKVCIKELFVNGLYVRGDHGDIYCRDEFRPIAETNFVREFHLMQTLNGSMVPRMIDNFEDHNTRYYVMEYIEGLDLGEMVFLGGHFPVSEALSRFDQILDITELMHQSRPGMVHCDIKPSNLMWRNGYPVLLDFFNARPWDGQVVKNGKAIVSTGYAAPELYDEAAVITPSTDVYSLGATLFFMLSGMKPADALSRTLQPDIDPEKLHPNIPAEIAGVILKAMDLDAGSRFASVGEFRQQLRLCSTTYRKMPNAVSDSVASPEATSDFWLLQNKMHRLLQTTVMVVHCGEHIHKIKNLLEQVKDMQPAHHPRRLELEKTLNMALSSWLQSMADLHLKEGHVNLGSDFPESTRQLNHECRICKRRLLGDEALMIRLDILIWKQTTRVYVKDTSIPAALHHALERIGQLDNHALCLELKAEVSQALFSHYLVSGDFFLRENDCDSAELHYLKALEMDGSSKVCKNRLQQVQESRRQQLLKQAYNAMEEMLNQDIDRSCLGTGLHKQLEVLQSSYTAQQGSDWDEFHAKMDALLYFRYKQTADEAYSRQHFSEALRCYQHALARKPNCEACSTRIAELESLH